MTAQPPNWNAIDTVLLDMDGTLLDLHYDNYFWLQHLPQRYADIHGIPLATAQQQLKRDFLTVAGSLNWYCLDYWEAKLAVPLMALKREVAHLIRMRDDTVDFLAALQRSGKRVVMLTNAHPAALALKLEFTPIAPYFDALLSTHSFGASKESLDLWQRVQDQLQFDPQRTLFIDDSPRILSTAQQFGIGYLVHVANPDSQRPAQPHENFYNLHHYEQLTRDLV